MIMSSGDQSASGVTESQQKISDSQKNISTLRKSGYSISLGNKLLAAMSLSEREINISKVREYIVEGAALDCVDAERYTPLHLAVWHQNQELVDMLIEHGSPLDELSDGECSTPLLLACSLGNVDIVKALVQKGANLFFLDERDGNAALHIAAENGFQDIVKELINLKLDPFIKNFNGRTPFDLSKLMGFKEIENYLCMETHNLQHRCRLVILDSLKSRDSHTVSERISVLPLPKKVKDYLKSYPN
ncbi:hypothetical protein GCM10023116_26190 [Kistimonas scapharcae]|uniref:SOCS box domain-containing protein n=1 Tax=Kistimonas scapharcae TaxID=1036133 RepID=A0ABP8V316_9GAMM